MALLSEKRPGWGQDTPMVALRSPYRSTPGAPPACLEEPEQSGPRCGPVTVVLPECVPATCWHSPLHGQMIWLIKAVLLCRGRRFGYQRQAISVRNQLLSSSAHDQRPLSLQSGN